MKIEKKYLVAPLTAQLEITDFCNHKCVHCYNLDSKIENRPIRKVSDETVLACAQSLIDSGIFAVVVIVQRFKGLAIYGWDFVNCGDKDFDTWKDRLSFNYSTGKISGLTNTIDLFQEGGDQHIDIRIWFDNFEIVTPKYESVELEDFLENGKRGWDAIYANNEKMQNFGIIPAISENEQKLKSMINDTVEVQRPKSLWTKLKDRLKH